MQFIDTLYEQREPVGDRDSRGIHYSVLRGRLWHKPDGTLSPIAIDHTFVVLWDLDHDERVLLAVEHFHKVGLLSNIKFIGEHKGVLSIIPLARSGAQFPKGIDVTDDCWSIEDDRDRSLLCTDYYGRPYLAGIESMWTLGGKPAQSELDRAYARYERELAVKRQLASRKSIFDEIPTAPEAA